MTTLLYLENTYNFESTAKIIDTRTLEDGRTAILLDATLFYPQGGGQPCDIGTISTTSSVFNVTDVRMDKDGNVLHLGSFEKGTFTPGDNVTLSINRDRRIKNAKAHSAGHLIDCIITQLRIPLILLKDTIFQKAPMLNMKAKLITPKK